MPKKPAANRGAYASSRPKAGAPRHRYVVIAVTEQEKQQITEYCERHGISVSSFLAQVSLKAVQTLPKVADEEDEEITLTLRFPKQEMDKLRISARQRQKSVAEMFQEGLNPKIPRRLATNPPKWVTIRCWLSKEEHKTITKFLHKHHLSARTYLAFAVLKAIENR